MNFKDFKDFKKDVDCGTDVDKFINICLQFK